MYASTCMCSDPDCRLHGCKQMRSHPIIQSPWAIPPELVGCICPPTSEQTCQRTNCPRQNPFAPRQNPFAPVTTEVNTHSKET